MSGTNVAEVYRAWMDKGLHESGVPVRTLGRALDISGTQVSRMRHGLRRIRADEIPVIERALGIRAPVVSPNGSATVRCVAIEGDAGANAWQTAGSRRIARQHPLIPAVIDQRFADLAQSSVRVTDDAMEPLIPKGDYVIFVPFSEATKDFQQGKIVVARQTAGKKTRMLVRRLAKRGHGTWELRSIAKDFDAIPIVSVGAFSVEVIGLVIWRGRPI